MMGKTNKIYTLDFSFGLKTFDGKPFKKFTEAAQELVEKGALKEGELNESHFVAMTAAEQLSSLIGKSNKDFNGKGWAWRVGLHHDKKLELDKVDSKLLYDFIKEQRTSGALTNDIFYVNYEPVFEEVNKENE